MAADLLAVLAMDPEQAATIVALGALPLLSALLNLQHSPGVCSLLCVHLTLAPHGQTLRSCASKLLLHLQLCSARLPDSSLELAAKVCAQPAV